MDPLLAWRSEFPILGHTVYMISHSLGAMPARAATRLQEFTDTWATRGIRAWEEGWWNMPITVGNLVGAIIGAGECEVVMQQNVSICQSVVTSCFDWSGRRNKLVTEGLNFPSNDYVYHGLARQGACIVTVDSHDGFTLPPSNSSSTPSMRKRSWSPYPTSHFAARTCRTWGLSWNGRMRWARW